MYPNSILRKLVLQLYLQKYFNRSLFYKSDIFYFKKIPIQNDFLPFLFPTQFFIKEKLFFFSFYNFYLQKLFPNPIFILERDFLFLDK